jgi:hypothetical protein
MMFTDQLLALALALQSSVPAAMSPEAATPNLLHVRRLYVDRLNGEAAEQMRDLLITALQNSNLFVLTEDEEKADAVLRGSAEDLIYTELHQTSDSINGGVSTNGAEPNENTRGTRRFGARAQIGQSESSRIQERRHEAMASVRIVSKEGDVLWSTTQESRGAKFRGSAADVAEKIAAQLKLAIENQRKRVKRAAN